MFCSYLRNPAAPWWKDKELEPRESPCNRHRPSRQLAKQYSKGPSQNGSLGSSSAANDHVSGPVIQDWIGESNAVEWRFGRIFNGSYPLDLFVQKIMVWKERASICRKYEKALDEIQYVH